MLYSRYSIECYLFVDDVNKKFSCRIEKEDPRNVGSVRRKSGVGARICSVVRVDHDKVFAQLGDLVAAGKFRLQRFAGGARRLVNDDLKKMLKLSENFIPIFTRHFSALVNFGDFLSKHKN